MNEDDPQLDNTTERLRRRLLKTGRLRRSEARRALGPHRAWTDTAAERLASQGFAVKEPGQQGSWVLRLSHAVADLPAPAGSERKDPRPGGAPRSEDEDAGLAQGGPYGGCDATGVVYRLADQLLHGCRASDGDRDWDQVWHETRAAAAHLRRLQDDATRTAEQRALTRRFAGRAPLPGL